MTSTTTKLTSHFIVQIHQDSQISRESNTYSNQLTGHLLQLGLKKYDHVDIHKWAREFGLIRFWLTGNLVKGGLLTFLPKCSSWNWSKDTTNVARLLLVTGSPAWMFYKYNNKYVWQLPNYLNVAAYNSRANFAQIPYHQFAYILSLGLNLLLPYHVLVTLPPPSSRPRTA